MAIGRDVLEQLARLIRPLQVRVANSIARAVVQLADDSTKLQLLQLGVLAGEDVDDAERFQEYGFTSVPLPGAEAVVNFPNGDRSQPLVVGVDDRRYRPTGWEGGESGLYNHVGTVVRLKADGTVEVTSGGAAVPLATKADLEALRDAIVGWTPVGTDGGAALKAALVILFGTSPAWQWPDGTTKLKGE